jgi:hypothetical protein
MTEPVDTRSRLWRVITLLLLDLALPAVLAALFIAFRQSLVDYQLARMDLPSGAELAGIRDGLSAGPWSRAVVVVIVAVVHTFLIRRLRAGRRGAWRRVLLRAVVGIAGIGYLVLSGQYPVWVRAEQIVQGLVLLGLLWAATRPAVRALFARPAVSAA